MGTYNFFSAFKTKTLNYSVQCEVFLFTYTEPNVPKSVSVGWLRDFSLTREVYANVVFRDELYPSFLFSNVSTHFMGQLLCT